MLFYFILKERLYSERGFFGEDFPGSFVRMEVCNRIQACVAVRLQQEAEFCDFFDQFVIKVAKFLTIFDNEISILPILEVIIAEVCPNKVILYKYILFTYI